MSAVPHTSLPSRAAYTAELVYRLTVDQYHQLIASGSLTDEDPVELLEGVLVYKMWKNSPHILANKLLLAVFMAKLPAGWHYQAQDPITLADSEPEPDGAVIRGAPADYALAKPGTGDVPLVIEIADSSLERDRGLKLRVYARAGIPTYWIVNLIDRQVEAFTLPDPSAKPEPTYTRRAVYYPGNAVPLAIAGQSRGSVAVNDLLPAATA